jgi:hypothetical protein
MLPTLDELVSSPLVHRAGDEMFNPPSLTNFLGVVQADLDPVALRCLSFPPFGTAWGTTGALLLDGRSFASSGEPVTFTWRPDRVVREANWNGWRVVSTVALATGELATLCSIEIRNEGSARELEVGLALTGGITKQTDAWRAPYPPGEDGNAAEVRANGVAFTARTSTAAWVQAGWPQPADVRPDTLIWRAHLAAGERLTLRFVTAIAELADDAFTLADRMLAELPAQIEATRADWDAELAAIFTPGNDRYGGSLPLLETRDDDLRKIYALGALGVTMFRRDSPYSFIGRTYDTLLPAFWQTATFLWDYSLSGQVHALLDPEVMRRHLEHWMATDVHTCFGTEWLTGSPMGGWYSVNDYAMIRLLEEYLRWTGDVAWLDTKVPLPDGTPLSVRDHLGRFATNWERFRTPHGLADYGGINNLLECVSTYVHEIAALNAGNVHGLRVAAEVARLDGDGAASTRMRAQADALVAEIGKLYADGQGFWNTRFPDGSLVPVRHCYDFITVMATMGDDLSATQRDEMASFCLREFRTPTWMRALSVNDPDAAFSTRPDHQWTGAYPAWPPLALAGLWRAGKIDDAVSWLRDMAATANQGPYGQAHFAEDFVDPDAGGARKAPASFPYITDWSCSSNGAWVQLVIGSIFGVRAGLDGSISATPAFGSLDPDARLTGLRFRGALYDVDRDGIVRRG